MALIGHRDTYSRSPVPGFRVRLIDTAGSELAIVTYSVPNVREGDTVDLPDGRSVTVLEVYDDEDGQEDGVSATLVVDVG
jgi:hypothetical protein